jgi:hypothetical protein
MPRRDSGKDVAAPPLPGFTTQTKPNCNDGACHPDPDAKGTEDESDADAEEEFDESTGKKKRNYTGHHSYRLIKEWVTGPHASDARCIIDLDVKRR